MKFLDSFYVLFPLFLFFVVIFLTEIIFRLWFRSKKGYTFKPVEKIKYSESHHISHPFLPSVNRPSFTAPGGAVELPINSLELFYKPIKTNSYGYFFNEELLLKENLIVFLGNCTFGTGYYKDNEYYCLPDYMNRIIGDNYSFVPIARGGWTSMDIIFHLYTNVLEFKPKVVVFGFGLNDIIPSLVPNYKVDYSHYFLNLGEFKLRRKIRDIMPKIKFWHLYEYILTSHLGTGNIRYDLLNQTSKSKPDLNKNFDGLRSEKRNIESMIAICKQHNIIPIITTYLYYLYDEVKNKSTYKKFKEGVDIENENIRKIAKKFDIYLIDVEKDFPFKRECFLDTTHLSPFGMKQYSEIFLYQFKEILENKNFH